MFEPKSYWERRTAVAESLVQQLLNVVGNDNPPVAEMLAQQWMASNSQLKDAEVERQLGPVSDEVRAGAADAAFIQTLLQMNLGKFYFRGVDQIASPAEAIGTDETAFDGWLALLPNFHQDLGTDIIPGFFREEEPDGAVGVIFVFIVNDQLYAMASANYTHVMALSIAHLPERFSWKNGYFRSELYGYRGDLSRVDFVVALANALDNQPYEIQPQLFVTGLSLDEIELIENKIDHVDLVLTVREPVLIETPDTTGPTAAANDDSSAVAVDVSIDSSETENDPVELSNTATSTDASQTEAVASTPSAEEE